jgi:integrase
MTGRNARPGRPPKYVKDPNGDDVVGLSFHKGQGFYHATGDRSVKFGKAYLPAIRLFRVWESDQKQTRVDFDDHEIKTRPVALVEMKGKTPERVLVSKRYASIPEAQFYAQVAEWLSDPLKCRKLAQATGYPLDRLETLPPVPKAISLKQAYANYCGKLKKPSPKEQSQVEWAWDDLSKSVAVTSLREVTKDAVIKWVHSLFDRYSVKMARNRVARAKTVLRYNWKNEHDVPDCERILRYLAAQEMPSTRLLNPNPISREDFHTLLNAARTEENKRKYPYWESMLLTALNCAYYAIDLIRLPVRAVDLERGTIVFVREKKNTPRVAVLWKSTIDALRPILAGRNDRKYVWESYRKGQWSRGGFANSFAAFRDKAGLKGLDFNQIRDGALTACGELQGQAQLLAGHRVAGELDAYAMRNPEKVRQACEAIERFYFPSPEKPKRKSAGKTNPKGRRG